jgi:hypothetical protein
MNTGNQGLLDLFPLLNTGKDLKMQGENDRQKISIRGGKKRCMLKKNCSLQH